MRTPAFTQILAVFALAALAACAPPPEPAAPAEPEPALDLAAEEAAIREFSQKWMVAEQDRDLLTVMSFMDADVTTIFDGKIVVGRPAVQADTEAGWQANPDATAAWTTSAVEVAASGDLAYERGSWTVGDEVGEFVTVWKKVGGEWKVVVDAGSTIQPASDG